MEHSVFDPNFNRGIEPKRVQTGISPRHICWPCTPLPGHKAHAHSAAIWPLYLYQGMMPMCGAPSSLALFVPEYRGRKARRRSCRWRRLWMKQSEIRSRMGGRIRDVPWGLSPSQGPWSRRRFLRWASGAFRTAERRTGSLMVQDEQRSSLAVVCVVDWWRQPDGTMDQRAGCVYVCVCVYAGETSNVCTSLLLIEPSNQRFSWFEITSR